MTDLLAMLQTASPLALGLLGLVSGALLGYAHFISLRRVTALYLQGGATLRALALQLARLAVLAALLTGLALLGAVPLSGGAVGIMLARLLVLRRARREI